MSDLHYLIASEDKSDVIDITEDEDTLPYWTKEDNDFEAIDNDIVTMLSLIKPEVQQAFSPKPAETSPPSCIDEDLDVIYIANQVDVVVIEDDNDISEDNESTTIVPNSHLHPDKLQRENLTSGPPGSPARASLRSPPSSPSSKDIKDLILPHIKLEEIAMNLKAKQIFATEAAAMVAIPSTERSEAKDFECYDLTEEDEEALLCSPPPNNNVLHSEEMVNCEPSSTYSIYEQYQNSSISKLASNHPGEEDPLEGPSTRFDNDSCSTMELSCPNIPVQPAPPNNVPSPNLILSSRHSPSEASKYVECNKLLTRYTNSTSLTEISPPCLTEQASTYDETSTTRDMSLIPSEEMSVLSPQSSFFQAFSTDETPSTFAPLPKLSSNKTSIFDDPKLLQFYYQKMSPETQKHFDKICILRHKIMGTLNKYSFDDFTKPEVERTNATPNVENDEIGKVNDQKTREKTEVTFLNNPNKVRKIDKENDIESIAIIQKNLKCFGTELFSSKTLNDGKSRINEVVEGDNRNINNKKPLDPELSNQSNEIKTPKKSCLPKNTTSKEKKTVKFEVDIKEKDNIVKSRKRSSFDDKTPRGKVRKTDKKNLEQSNKNVVVQPELTEQSTSYECNKRDIPRKIVRNMQKPLKRNKKDKRLKTYATYSSNFYENDERKHSELNSKQQFKNIKKISPPKTSDVAGRHFKAEQPITTITVKIKCGTRSIGETQQALIASNSVPSGQQNTGMSMFNNMPYPEEYSESTPNPNIQSKRLDAQKYLETNAANLKFNKNTRQNNYRPKPPRSRNAINPHINIMSRSSLANLRKYPQGTSSPACSNIREPSRYQQNNYMTVNGIPPIAHSNADNLRIHDMLQYVDLLSYPYFMPPRLQTPPHYQPPQQH